MSVMPRMRRTERYIAVVVLGGLTLSVAVGSAVAYGIERAVRKRG